MLGQWIMTVLIHDHILDEHTELVYITRYWLDDMEGLVAQKSVHLVSWSNSSQCLITGKVVLLWSVGSRSHLPDGLCGSLNFWTSPFDTEGLGQGETLVGVLPLCWRSVYLQELSDMVSDVMLESDRLVVLRDFNILANALHDKTAWICGFHDNHQPVLPKRAALYVPLALAPTAACGVVR